MTYDFSSVRKRVLAVVLGAAAVSAGCKAGSCEDELVDRAVSFMKAHQECAVDADCVVVSDHCATLPGGYCGQLTMNLEGRDSAEWASIDKELADCADDSCDVCLAALLPRCNAGSCGGP